MKEKKYKLYHREAGYKCAVTIKELCFLFALELDTIEAIQEHLTHNATSYFIAL